MKRRPLRPMIISGVPIAILVMGLIIATLNLIGVQSSGGLMISSQTPESTVVTMDENAAWGDVVRTMDRLPPGARISIGGPTRAAKK